MTKYIKLLDSIYELSFEPKDKDLIFLALSSKPTLHKFEELCLSWNVKFSLNRLGPYCQKSEIMKSLVFKEGALSWLQIQTLLS